MKAMMAKNILLLYLVSAAFGLVFGNTNRDDSTLVPINWDWKDGEANEPVLVNQTGIN